MAPKSLIRRIISNPLVQTFLIYVSGGWIAVEIADYLFLNHGLINRAGDILNIILFVGLPMVIFLARHLGRYRYEKPTSTEKGLVIGSREKTGMRKKLILIFVIYCQILAAQKPVILDDSVQEVSISDMQLQFLGDSQCSILPSELFSGMMSHQFKVLDFNDPDPALMKNISGSCFWFRIYFVNRSTSQFSFHLQRNEGSEFDEYTLYQRFDNGLVSPRRSGNLVHPRKKDVNIGGSDDLRIYLPPSESDTLYLRVILGPESALSDLSLTISTQHSVLAHDRTKRLLFGILTGILLIMILYHIPLFVRGREKSYLYYILYILAFLFFFINKEGYIYELIPRLISAPITIFLLEIFLLFFLLFGRSYLDTRNTLQSWDKILRIAVWLTVSGLILNFALILLQGLGVDVPFFIELGGFAIMIVSAIGGLFLAIVPAVILTRKNHQPARYFLIANLFLILGVVINYALNAYWLGEHSLEMGIILQALTFSFGLSEKISLLKKDMEQAQLRIIDQLKENSALKDKVNRELETKVKERTREIIEQKDEIEAQRDEIESQFEEIETQRDRVVSTNNALEEQKRELESTLENLKIAQSQLVQSEKMASMGILTAGIAHELNNPINFVSGNVNPLIRDVNDLFNIINKYEEIVETNKFDGPFGEVEKLKVSLDYSYLIKEIISLLEGIEDGANRSSDIVKGLRSFSRLDEEKPQLYNIHEGIDSALILLNSKIKNRIKIRKEYGDLKEIECFPGKLNQVILNILTNSIQAIDDKGEIFIKTVSGSIGAKIFIKDNGKGMTPEVKKHIFDPFFTTKDVGAGTGLGLSISYGIIEQHSGNIDVISEPGKGTEFIISLPKTQPD